FLNFKPREQRQKNQPNSKKNGTTEQRINLEQIKHDEPPRIRRYRGNRHGKFHETGNFEMEQCDDARGGSPNEMFQNAFLKSAALEPPPARSRLLSPSCCPRHPQCLAMPEAES